MTIAAESGPLTILEAGCGLGAMAERLLEWNLVPQFDYLGLDLNAGALQEAYRRLAGFAELHSFSCEKSDGLLLLNRDNHVSRLRFLPVDVFDFAADKGRHGSWDLLIAHAFLDLVPLASALPLLLALVRPGGLCYFSLNFDGVTTFLPPLDDDLDEQLERLYHHSMHNSTGDGPGRHGSRSGRLLLTLLSRLQVEILSMGSSDWAVLPHKGTYPQDEAYFLHYLLHLLEEALTGNKSINPSLLQSWLSSRRSQVEQGELMLLTHQWDLLGKVPAAALAAFPFYK